MSDATVLTCGVTDLVGPLSASLPQDLPDNAGANQSTPEWQPRSIVHQSLGNLLRSWWPLIGLRFHVVCVHSAVRSPYLQCRGASINKFSPLFEVSCAFRCLDSCKSSKIMSSECPSQLNELTANHSFAETNEKTNELWKLQVALLMLGKPLDSRRLRKLVAQTIQAL